MTRSRAPEGPHDHDPGHQAAGPGPGKRTLAEGLPVQRRSEAAAASTATTPDPAPAPTAADDPFGMHLPAPLKSGVEALSGMSMDHVQVHRDSAKPAEVGALAYAQGAEIHLGPGQEQHLPHEAWHVVQQAQGRVAPTTQLKQQVAVNDDAGLEAEADVMGAKALAVASSPGATAPDLAAPGAGAAVVQRIKGAPGTKNAGQAIDFTINDEFVEKHVANDLEEAKTVTNNRIKSGGPPGIVAGTAANHLATLANWTTAIKAAKDVVPPDGDWASDHGDQEQFVNQLAKVEVVGWEAQGTLDNVAAKVATNKKFVGGTWKVTGSENDEDDVPKDGTGTAEMDISHLTS